LIIPRNLEFDFHSHFFVQFDPGLIITEIFDGFAVYFDVFSVDVKVELVLKAWEIWMAFTEPKILPEVPAFAPIFRVMFSNDFATLAASLRTCPLCKPFVSCFRRRLSCSIRKPGWPIPLG